MNKVIEYLESKGYIIGYMKQNLCKGRPCFYNDGYFTTVEAKIYTGVKVMGRLEFKTTGRIEYWFYGVNDNGYASVYSTSGKGFIKEWERVMEGNNI